MNTQLNLSTDLRHFKIIPGENIVLLAPKYTVPDNLLSFSPRNTPPRLKCLAAQLASNLAWSNPGQVLYITTDDHAKLHADMVTSLVCNMPQYRQQDLNVDYILKGYTCAPDGDTAALIYVASQRLMNKVQLRTYKEIAEDDNGGVADYIKKLVEKAGSNISAVIVGSLDRIAEMNGDQKEEKTTHPNGRVTITYTREVHWQAPQRKMDIIKALGEVAKEKNIPCISTYTPTLTQEEFSSCKSLGRRCIIGWDSQKMKEHVDRLYGVTADTHPLHPGKLPQPLQKLTEYVVNTKEINTYKIIDMTPKNCSFSCLDDENCLDIFA